MLEQELYVQAKMRELEGRRLAPRARTLAEAEELRRRPRRASRLLGKALVAFGRRLERMGAVYSSAEPQS